MVFQVFNVIFLVTPLVPFWFAEDFPQNFGNFKQKCYYTITQRSISLANLQVEQIVNHLKWDSFPKSNTHWYHGSLAVAGIQDGWHNSYQRWPPKVPPPIIQFQVFREFFNFLLIFVNFSWTALVKVTNMNCPVVLHWWNNYKQSNN